MAETYVRNHECRLWFLNNTHHFLLATSFVAVPTKTCGRFWLDILLSEILWECVMLCKWCCRLQHNFKLGSLYGATTLIALLHACFIPWNCVDAVYSVAVILLQEHFSKLNCSTTTAEPNQSSAEFVYRQTPQWVGLLQRTKVDTHMLVAWGGMYVCTRQPCSQTFATLQLLVAYSQPKWRLWKDMVCFIPWLQRC